MMRTSLILYLAIPFALAVPARAISYTFQTVIDASDPNFTQLLGVNNSGVIAGYFGDGAAVFNNGFTVATAINGINDLGTLVGFYATGATAIQNGTPVTVPEPRSLVLVGLGLLCLGVFELRRRR